MLKRKTPLRKGKPLKAKKLPKPSLSELKASGEVVKASSLSNKKPMRKRAKGSTGEMKLFLRLYEERGGISEISGIPLLPPDHDWFARQFSHILPKGTYPELRLEESNIVLKTAEEHRQWEEEKWTLQNKQEWQWVFEREAQLKYAANA